MCNSQRQGKNKMSSNKNRKRQIVEFIDKDRKVMDKYYDIMEKDLSDKKLISEMKKLIAIDADFYDPYLVIAEILAYNGEEQEAQTMLKDAYERAVKRISDSQGRWPKIMNWGFLENRHIMRALESYADEKTLALKGYKIIYDNFSGNEITGNIIKINPIFRGINLIFFLFVLIIIGLIIDKI